MSAMEYADLLRLLRRTDAEIRCACRCGSRVYGTFGPRSDEDFTVVLADRGARQDLLFRDGKNVVIHGIGTFEKALSEQSVFALEALFAPAEHRLKEARPAIPWRLDAAKLAASASARSASDFAKAAKTFEEEPFAAKKKLFHAIRIPMFARQVIAKGRIVDFTEAAPIWREIEAREDLDWEAYARDYAPLRERLTTDLAAPPRRAEPR